MKKPIIKKISGKLPGPTVAIFSGIHGNEKAGVQAVKNVLQKIKLERGKAIFVIANPEALQQNKRYVNVNLNRLFSRSNAGFYYEYEIAHTLMDIMDESDALLDLHAYNDPTGKPFSISSKKDIPLANIFNTKTVTYGWTPKGAVSTAAEEYMQQQRKPAICLECGSVLEITKNVPFAEQSIIKFLKYFKLIKGNGRLEKNNEKTYVSIRKTIFVTDLNYSFNKKYRTFQKLVPGKTFLTQGKIRYKAGKNDLIIFPRQSKKIGEEICIIGRLIKKY